MALDDMSQDEYLRMPSVLGGYWNWGIRHSPHRGFGGVSARRKFMRQPYGGRRRFPRYRPRGGYAEWMAAGSPAERRRLLTNAWPDNDEDERGDDVSHDRL